MNTKPKTFFAGTAGLLIATGFLVIGCSTISKKSDTNPALIMAPSGAQLWAENCARCHNFRSPTTYSDGQWRIAGHHMRLRANLTAEQERKIVEFMQASN